MSTPTITPAPTPTRRTSALRSPPPQTPSSALSPSSAQRPTYSHNQSGLSTPTPTPTRRTSNLSAGLTTEQRRARRAELRHFYGLKEGGGSDSGDKRDINGAGFDAKGYYEDLIHKSTLEELMKAASSLSADIGKLHGDRHSLVYNHHHQLFAAGDTISHLNSRTPQLLGIMTSLQQSFSSMSQLVDSVALPDPPISLDSDGQPTGAGSVSDGKKRVWKGRLDRIRLMRIAQEPSQKIRTTVEKLLEEIHSSSSSSMHEEGDGDGNDISKSTVTESAEAIKELEEILADLPTLDDDGLQKDS
ncbi:Vps51/Vps67-domain-containing protein [Naematelia encephala]|uniref:Vacuolar protein sorting-associated protein 51 homolog n=1 Tax=Naematelia encephala TaxID=71784 RepID=A0A1Y2B0N1_9TREE|nr:Vps51/Vps67-domain-containing protein [Naematelia encephala]